jgi:hypothetical protein
MDIETNFREMRLPEVTDLLDESVDETWSYTIEDLARGIGNVINITAGKIIHYSVCYGK